MWERATDHGSAKKHGREKAWKSQFSYKYGLQDTWKNTKYNINTLHLYQRLEKWTRIHSTIYISIQ